MITSIVQRVQEFKCNNPIISNAKILKHPFSDHNKKDIIWSIIPKVQYQKKEISPFADELIHLLLYIRNLFKKSYEVVEGKQIAIQKSWSSSQVHDLQGGGVMTVFRGDILEKASVNLSVVAGSRYPGKNTGSKNDESFSGKPFVAAGVSLISHPRNPFAPIMHFNIRMIKVFGDRVHQWIGGGADLTPMEKFEEDTTSFHDTLKFVCEKNSNIADYPLFKKWADDYFYLPHRKEARGVGGIFFDYVSVQSDLETDFLLDVGQYMAHEYADILSRRVEMEYTKDLIEKHHKWRGRYAEFNLIYDRGTRFGLMSGGNHEAIFCSLPPQVSW